MATQISTIYDNLFALMEATFPDRTELEDPYNMAANTEVFLRNGWGVTWDSATDLDDLPDPTYYEERSVGIVFSGRINRTGLDTLRRRDIEKGLLEARKTIIDAIKTYPNIGAEYFEPSSDEGIQSVVTDKQNIIYLRINFIVRYQQMSCS